MKVTTLVNSNYFPSEQNLDQLFDNAHKNTVLAGFSRSIYLYFTDELIVLPFEIDGHEYIDPRSFEKVKIEANIYPNPFPGNEFTVSRISKGLGSYEVYTSDGILLSEGELNLLEQRINVNSNYIGLLILKITEIDGSIEIHKIVKAN